MTSVVEESFAPRLVVDNTKELDVRVDFWVYDPQDADFSEVIESPALYRALTGEEGFNVQ